MPEQPDADDAVFSNPLPPSHHHFQDDGGGGGGDAGGQPLTNADFRKLLMTPRVASTDTQQANKPERIREKTDRRTHVQTEERKKRKSYYAKLRKDEEERQKELAAKYRDRAQERRAGDNVDYDQTELVSTTADYRAVAPDAKSGANLAERRKLVIQESKFLGGDMEHTHLVKGLDYALLEKVRAEITTKEEEDEEEMEDAVSEVVKEQPTEEEEEESKPVQYKSVLGRNVHRIALRLKNNERNEHFLPHRMAYIVELDDEYNETDIPTTLLRSKSDCPTLESTTTLSTNDIVIQKLTQILSYLRQGKRDRKTKKKEKVGKVKEEERPKMADDSIYGNLGDYQPDVATKEKEVQQKSDHDRKDSRRGDRDRDRERDRRDPRDRDRDRRRDRDRHDRDRERNRDRDRRDHRDRGGRDEDREKKKSYFEKPTDEDDVPSDQIPTTAKELVQNINERFSATKVSKEPEWGEVDLGQEAGFRNAAESKPKTKDDENMTKINKRMAVDSYAECYPGMMESADAIDDSDDEVDFLKMDQGNKKGPVGRWDFETQEEYSSYMGQKEALPKAAFQYGLKMADGRKTRRGGPKDDKKELDREWQKIQNIIQKRKADGQTDGPHFKSGKFKD